MKLLYLTLMIAFAISAIGQTKSDDSMPVLEGSATYSMPQTAIDAGIEGSVLVAIRVDESGIPTDVTVAAGPMWPCGEKPIGAFTDLASTLTEAMKKLRFKPAMKKGKPVAKEVGIRLTLKNPKLAPEFIVDPATGKRRATMINGGVLNGKAADLPKPRYPAGARSAGASGQVEIQIVIDEQGKVLRAGAVSGDSLLHEAARDAACNAKFSPTRLEGNPVKVTGRLTYYFVS